MLPCPHNEEIVVHGSLQKAPALDNCRFWCDTCRLCSPRDVLVVFSALMHHVGQISIFYLLTLQFLLSPRAGAAPKPSPHSVSPSCFSPSAGRRLSVLHLSRCQGAVGGLSAPGPRQDRDGWRGGMNSVGDRLVLVLVLCCLEVSGISALERSWGPVVPGI